MEKALQMHIRVLHGFREPLQAKIGRITICPCCGAIFQERFRLIEHLTGDQRRALACKTFVSRLPDLDADLQRELRDKFKAARREARADGRTHPLATVPPRTHKTNCAEELHSGKCILSVFPSALEFLTS